MKASLDRLIRDALREDVGHGDVTTNATVPRESICSARVLAKQPGLLSGIEAFYAAFEILHAGIHDWWALSDGSVFATGEEIARFRGNTRAILTGERTALNFIQRLSGIATITAEFIKAVDGFTVRICDTRKTTPLMRGLEKQAVIHGGGMNHRYALFDGVVIKENHIVAAGGIPNAVKLARHSAHHLFKIEVEVTSLDEVDQAIAADVDAIMLDNMGFDDMREAVVRAHKSNIEVEASGNVTLTRVRQIAETGVDVISVGAVTHSARAIDLSLLISNV